MESHHKCEHCEEHSVNTMKIVQTCKRVERLEAKYEGLDSMINGKEGIHNSLTILDQKLEAYKYPLYIIATAALINIAKILFSFIPIAKAAGTVAGIN